MNQATDPFAGKSDEELRKQAKSYVKVLIVLGVLDTAYALFLLYSAASGNWSWLMGVAVVPLMVVLLGILVPMTQLATINRELTRRQDEKVRR